MILTGPKIEHEVAERRITVEPYDAKLVGPNSIDLRLADELKLYACADAKLHGLDRSHWPVLDMRTRPDTVIHRIPAKGVVLEPGILYLGRTVEVIGSDHYVPIVEGRSSIGRLGVRVHQTAGFCDTGFHGTITLEIDVLHPVRVYAGVPICQAYFLKPEGKVRLYEGRYQGQRDTTPSRIHTDDR